MSKMLVPQGIQLNPAPPQTPSVPLAIVGIGCLFPKAESTGFFWANVKNAVDAITEVPATHWDPQDYFDADPKKPDMTYARRGGFLSAVDFAPMDFGISPRDLEAIDTTQLLGLVAAKQALDDAGIKLTDEAEPQDEAAIARDRVSVILGVTGTLELVIPLGARLGHPKWRRALKEAGLADAVADDVVARISESYVPWQENSFPGLLGNVVAGRIANRLDLHGTNCVVDAACASSLSAIHLAALELATGKSDVVVTGGADTFNDIFMYMCFSKTPALSPSGDSRPFDANGDGTILGEGIGLVVLKRLADAEQAGDRIYAVIRGIGSSSDGKGNAIYAPSAEGQQRCLRDAYRRAGVAPETIELIEAHGTGTRVGDATEARGLAAVFAGAEAASVAIGSVKSQIGHTKAAAGAAALIKAALSLHNKVLPPTLKVSAPVEPLAADNSPFYVNMRMRPWLPRAEHPRRAGVSAFGFGGSNFHAVLEEHSPRKSEPDWDGRVEICPISANSIEALTAKLDALGSNPDWSTFARAAAEARQTFLTSAEFRLVLVAGREHTVLARLLASASLSLASDGNNFWQTPDGAFFGRGPAAGKLAVLFPGQGSQSVGMLRELTCLFPEMLDTLSAANATFAEFHSDRPRLSDLMDPPSRFQETALAEQENALRSTEVAQPALGAVSFGAWLTLAERFGVRSDAFAGHSFGELPALAAAGRIGVSDLLRLSCLRGQLMARQKEVADDPGTMLVVFESAEAIEKIIAGAGLEVVVANKNSPRQIVLSGGTGEVAKAVETLRARKIPIAPLPVAAAFHSPFVSAAAEPFLETLASVEFRAGVAPVFANTTGEVYPEEADRAREMLGHQLARPVEFVSEIRNLAGSGVRTFLEVGPGTVLSRLTETTLAESGILDAAAFSISASGARKSAVLDFACALGRLAARGHGVELAEWEKGSTCRPRTPTPPTKLVVPVCGANAVSPRPKRPASQLVQDGIARSAVTNLEARLSKTSGAGFLPQPLPDGNPSMIDPTNSPDLSQALQLTSQTLAALQRMQEETARLHRQFLERQEDAQRTLHSLMTLQHAILFPDRTPASVPAATVRPSTPSIAYSPAPACTTASPPTAVSQATSSPVIGQPASLASSTVTPLFDTLPAIITSAPTMNTSRTVAARPTPDLETQRVFAPPPRQVAENATGTANRVAPSADISSILLAVVAEKTGYPATMLTLDMTLDSDLGVDSIKRVEILSSLQERLPHAPVVKPEHIGTLHTLRDVERFLSADTQRTGVPSAPEPTSNANTNGPRRHEAQSDGGSSLPLSGKVGSATLPTSARNLPEPRAAVPTPVTTESLFGSGGTQRQSPDVAAVLLEVVSEKTGYPVDMLTLEMALDSDLGVDSIKRVEILSSLQERLPGAPVVKPEQIGTLHTLRDVALFLSGRPNTVEPPTFFPKVPAAETPVVVPKSGIFSPTESQAASEPAPRTAPVLANPMPESADSVLNSGSVRHAPVDLDSSISQNSSRSPSSMLSTDRIDRSILQVVDIDLTTPRDRHKLPAGGEVWIVGEDEPITHNLSEELAKARLTTLRFDWNEPDPTTMSGHPIGLVLVAPAKPAAGLPLNRLAFRWLQIVGPKLRNAARTGTAFFATVARLDGTFGLTDIDSSCDPTSGGLAGLVKTARLEWPELACKAIDLSPTFVEGDRLAAATVLADELLTAGPLEVGVTATHRVSPELVRTVGKISKSAVLFAAKDVVLITGGARGVTAEAAIAMAEAYRCTIAMVGRTALPGGPEPAWLAAATDEASMKKAIADNLGPAATPKTVADAYHRLAAQREIRQTLYRIEQTGARAAYFAADVTHQRHTADMLHQIQAMYGPITAFIHGAGVLADKKIEDLTVDQFDSVYRTKVDGLRNILDLLGGQELHALILFSSTTARLGRTGQIAYAVANEVLNKIAQVESRKRPTSRVVAINWGPWEGGMVTLPLRKVFETEGVGLIPLAEGGSFAVQELNTSDRAAEVVAMGKPGPLAKPGPGTFATSSKIRNSVAPSTPPTTDAAATSTGEYALAYERTLDLTTHPVLRSHVIDGRAVLPMSLHMEWLAHAALHGNPGLLFHGFNEMRVTHGVMVEEGQSTVIRATAARALKSDKSFLVSVEMRGKRRDGRDVMHSRAEVVLAAALPTPPTPLSLPTMQPYPHPLDEIYRYFLFHGPELQAIERVDGVSERAFVGSVYPAPTPAEWFHDPLRGSWVADPLVLDASFQMMILWSYAQHGAGSLPCFAGRYRQYRRTFPAGPVRVQVRITRDDGSFARADIEYIDAADGSLVAQIQDYECVIDPQLNQAFRRNQLMPRQKQQS